MGWERYSESLTAGRVCRLGTMGHERAKPLQDESQIAPQNLATGQVELGFLRAPSCRQMG
jgi:hypothetical protein